MLGRARAVAALEGHPAELDAVHVANCLEIDWSP